MSETYEDILLEVRDRLLVRQERGPPVTDGGGAVAVRLVRDASAQGHEGDQKEDPTHEMCLRKWNAAQRNAECGPLLFWCPRVRAAPTRGISCTVVLEAVWRSFSR